MEAEEREQERKSHSRQDGPEGETLDEDVEGHRHSVAREEGDEEQGDDEDVEGHMRRAN